MKKLIILIILLFAYPCWSADREVTDLTELSATPATGDLVVIVDVSDTTDSDEGTTKKITVSNAVGGYQFDIPGAVKDGSTDDTTAFQAAITAAAAGDTIFLSPGTYILSNITSVSDIKIVGASGTILKHKDAATDHMLECSGDVELLGLEFDGNRANITNRTIFPVHFDGDRLHIEDCKFTGSVYGAVYFKSDERVRICNNEFSDMAEHSGNAGEYTIAIKGASTAACQIWITGNDIMHGTPANAARAPGGISLSGVSMSANISDNYFKNIGCQDANNKIGNIDLYTDCDKSIISNNRFDDYYYQALKLQNSGQLIVTGNIIDQNADGNASNAMQISYERAFGSALEDWIIANNIIELGGEDNIQGISCSGDGTNTTKKIIIQGNIIRDSYTGIRLDNEARDVVIANNIIEQFSYRAIHIDDTGVSASTTVTINGGIIDDGSETPVGHVVVSTNVTNLRLKLNGVTFIGNPSSYWIYMNTASALIMSNCDFVGTAGGTAINLTSVTTVEIDEHTDCSIITAGMCRDTDDGVLYSWDGDSVNSIGDPNP
jgi:hypothetical protein